MSIERRLQALEARRPPSTADRRVFRFIGSAAECMGHTADLIASGTASESDLFIHRVLVDPPSRGAGHEH
jgi:hypothetical protein